MTITRQQWKAVMLQAASLRERLELVPEIQSKPYRAWAMRDWYVTTWFDASQLHQLYNPKTGKFDSIPAMETSFERQRKRYRLHGFEFPLDLAGDLCDEIIEEAIQVMDGPYSLINIVKGAHNLNALNSIARGFVRPNERAISAIQSAKKPFDDIIQAEETMKRLYHRSRGWFLGLRMYQHFGRTARVPNGSEQKDLLDNVFFAEFLLELTLPNDKMDFNPFFAPEVYHRPDNLELSLSGALYWFHNREIQRLAWYNPKEHGIYDADGYDEHGHKKITQEDVDKNYAVAVDVVERLRGKHEEMARRYVEGIVNPYLTLLTKRTGFDVPLII